MDVNVLSAMPINDLMADLQRYGRALTGSPALARRFLDATRVALESGRVALDAKLPLRIALFRAFNDVWWQSALRASPSSELRRSNPDWKPFDHRLQALDDAERAAFLLTSMEGFGIRECAAILRLSRTGVEDVLLDAECEIGQQLATHVLIIEDEPIIAADLEQMMLEDGHTVAGIAATRAESVAVARRGQLGLVLADLRLADGSSGLDAVRDVLQITRVPVIFITAFSEKLIGEALPEDSTLVSKPFAREALHAAIAEQLFFHEPDKRIGLA